jgi:hypothetical protein
VWEAEVLTGRSGARQSGEGRAGAFWEESWPGSYGNIPVTARITRICFISAVLADESCTQRFHALEFRAKPGTVASCPTLLAGYLPAWRAARVDPTVALRVE